MAKKALIAGRFQLVDFLADDIPKLHKIVKISDFTPEILEYLFRRSYDKTQRFSLEGAMFDVMGLMSMGLHGSHEIVNQYLVAKVLWQKILNGNSVDKFNVYVHSVLTKRVLSENHITRSLIVHSEIAAFMEQAGVEGDEKVMKSFKKNLYLFNPKLIELYGLNWEYFN